MSKYCLFKRGIFVILLLSIMMFLHIGDIQAKEENIEGNTVENVADSNISISAWPASDFKWNGNTITGLTETGVEHLKTDSHMVLPEKNTDGMVLTGIDKMAFALLETKYKVKLTAVDIPNTVKSIGQAAFFRNDISGTIVLPSGIEEVPIAAFRGNAIEKIIFEGNIQKINKLAFAENRLTELDIPNTLKSIGENAFMTNPGVAQYGDHVILWTPNHNNPSQIKDAENYYIDPGEDKKTDTVDASSWDYNDFIYEDDTILGFSDLGKKKIKRNKYVKIPNGTPSGKVLKKVGKDAFRNLQTGYDIEQIDLPDSIETLDNYCLQFNKLKQFTFPKETRRLGYGVFMDCGLNHIELPEKLEYIDQIAFFGNHFETLTIPNNVKHIGVAAFRQCNIKKLNFRGESLEKIDKLAFAENQLTEVNIPASLREIGYQGFTKNPGVEKYKGAVVLHTPNRNNPQNLPNDDNGAYVVDPDYLADKSILRETIKDAQKIISEGESRHGRNFWEYFSKALNQAKEIEKKEGAAAGECALAAKNLRWILSRAALDALVVEAQKFDLTQYEDQSIQFLKDAVTKGSHDVMVLNISDKVVQTDEKNIESAKELLVKKGQLLSYHILEGSSVVKVRETLWQNNYPANIKIAVSKDTNKLLYLLDNGTESYLKSNEKMEEHDYPYWRDALKALMDLFSGKNREEISKISSKELSDAIKKAPDARTSATLSAKGIQNAVLAAFDQIENNKPNDKDRPIKNFSIDKQLWSNKERIENKEDKEDKVNDKVDNKKDVTKQEKFQKNAYISGYPDGGIHPESNMTRAEVAVILNRLLTLPKAEVKNKDFWAAEDIAAVQSAGLMKGYQDGSFGENKQISRAELAVIMVRVKKDSVNMNVKIPLFSDTIGHWAEKDLNTAAAMGMITGYPDHKMYPDKAVTRAEAVTMMNRCFEINISNISEEKSPWNDLTPTHWAFKEFIAAKKV